MQVFQGFWVVGFATGGIKPFSCYSSLGDQSPGKGSVFSSAWMFAKLAGVESDASPCRESGLGVLALSAAGKGALPAQSEQSPRPSPTCLERLDPSPPQTRRSS